MNFQICPLTVRINGQNNGIGCGMNIFEIYGCVAKNVETFGGRTKLTPNNIILLFGERSTSSNDYLCIHLLIGL